MPRNEGAQSLILVMKQKFFTRKLTIILNTGTDLLDNIRVE